MSSTNKYFIGEERQQQQQQDTYSSINIHDHSFRLNDMIEISLINITNRNLNGSLYYSISNFEYTTLTYKISMGFICACLCLLTITGNLFVLITFRRIRKVGNLFILSLATADLIVGCFVMPIAGIYAIMEKWNMGLILCQIWLSVDFTASTASIFNLLTLSLDRYWSITSPLQYLGKRTRTRALLLIGFAWGLSLLWVIPIFSWHHFNNGTRYVESDKCEPEYTHSKVFKVSTAVINFYLPLLVLISLNGRMYFEIKRRYRNALLQRYSNKATDSPNTCKLHPTRKNSRIPITMTLCDSDRQICKTPMNYIENDNLTTIPQRLSVINDNNLPLRINYTEKRNRSSIPVPLSTSRQSSLKHTYSFAEKNHCTQDELLWFARHDQPRSSLSPTPTLRPRRTGSKRRLNVDERCFKHTHDCPSCRFYSNEQLEISQRHHRNSYHYYQTQPRSSFRSSISRTTLVCRRCSLNDAMKATTTTTTTTTRIFNLCLCCSAASSATTIHSDIDPYNNNNKTRTLSVSSASSNTGRRKNKTLSSNLKRNSTISNIVPRANSYICRRSSSRMKQTTVWNQQEKAFRQLFAIVFGFTVCFLPYFILYMVVAFCGSCVSERFLTVTIWLGYVNSTINPFLYALSNKHFRQSFNHIFKRNRRRQSYYN
ncbi:unnamed protein product [Adineta steineri]|uniref:G-protein coupled receptors family 1 profile domain-containing protein n=1 Tax=Adineta steineri TaxID=433720 RepID=A0A814C389_9BILA|nr:unnamed protein product [Adineta steineri]CAF1059693.1 unnamed protein product [Adineta steineri]